MTIQPSAFGKRWTDLGGGSAMAVVMSFRSSTSGCLPKVGKHPDFLTIAHSQPGLSFLMRM